MNIIEAVSAAEKGKKIRRRYWHHTHYIYGDGNDIFFGRFLKEFVFDSKKSYAKYLDAEAQYIKYQNEEEKIIERSPYIDDYRKITLRIEDYLANDWEVVE